jgi:cell wall-associated NlpC family hydrolase
VLVLRGSSTLNEAERRTIFRSQALARDRDVQDRLQEAREDLGLKEGELTRSRDAADRLAKSLAKRRKAADALVTKYEALERDTQGDLARLVDEARRRKAAEEARLARLALQRRAESARKALAQLEADARKASRTTAADGRGATASPLSPKAGSTNARARELAVEAGLSAELPASPGGRAAVQAALSQLGKPYIWGADGPGGFDCSGLMLFAWHTAGKSLPHSSRSQYASTTRVAVGQVKPGDLVFYGSPIHHVGMYVGNGQMVEASRRGKPVKMSSIFRRDLVGVGRVG